MWQYRPTPRAAFEVVHGTVATPWEISGDDLTDWSQRRESAAKLPLLVRRLLATTMPLQALDMRGDSGVQLPGWDGLVRASKESPWCPAGVSYWECTVETGRDKFDRDFAKRSATAPPDASRSTYIAVTAGRVPSKQRWCAEKRASGIWVDVRMLDADDLAAWLEQSPATSLWMMDELGKSVVAASTPNAFLNAWSRVTSPPLPADLTLLGPSRDEAAKRLRQATLEAMTRIQRSDSGDEQGGLIYVAASHEAEARVFALAALVNDPEPDRRERLMACAIVVESADTWRWLVRASSPRNPTVLLPAFDGVDLASASSRAVVIAPTSATRHDVVVRLEDYVPYRELGQRLRHLGLTRDEAERLAHGAGGRVWDVRQMLSAVTLPAWTRNHEPALWMPLLLIGRWRPSYAADRAVVEELGATASEVERLCESLSREVPPAIRRAEEGDRSVTWEWSAPESIWVQCARLITEEDLRRFGKIAVEVLETHDPRFDVHAHERFAHGAMDRRQRPSSELREGVANTLARLAWIHKSIEDTTAGRRGKSVAAGVVRAVLTPPWKRWASLASELPLLAEASPEEFLSALERSIAEGDEGCSRLFAEEGDFSSPHAGLLWAIERLAWERRWMRRAVSALATLATRDPGGKLMNRPLRSLAGVLDVMVPQTVAPIEERLSALDHVLSTAPDTGWKLILAILPSLHGGLIQQSARPVHLHVEGIPEEVEVFAGHVVVARDVLERAVHAAGTSPTRWVELLDDVTSLDVELALQALKALDEKRSQLQDEDALVWSALRKLARRKRLGQNVDDPVHRAVGALYEKLTPTHLAVRAAWLFGDVELLEFDRADWRRSEEIAATRRDEALRELADLEEPWRELEELARRASRTHLIGWHLASSPLADQFLERHRLGRLPRELQSGATALLLALANSRGDEWLFRELELLASEGRVDEVVGALIAIPKLLRQLSLLPRLGSAVEDGYWQRVGWFNGDELDDEQLCSFARALLDRRRAAAAVRILTSAHKRSLPGEIYLAALTALLDSIGTCETDDFLRDSGASWSIEQCLLAIDRAGDVDEATLARLELRLFGLIGDSTRSAKALYSLISREPAEFVHLLKALYRPGDRDPSEEAESPTPEAMRAAEAAWRLLHEWRGYPGADLPAAERELALESWVDAVFTQAAEVSRSRIARHEAADVLARAPAAEDGAWPCLAARRLLEREPDDELARGLRIAKFNLRGMTKRAFGEGGRQEREIAAGFRRGAEMTRREWPRTAEMLDHLADRYEDDARHEDEEARTDMRRAGVDPAQTPGETMNETPPPPVTPMRVEKLFLREMEFTREAAPEFGPRLNVITGDNSTGKSVVLDAIWWALTGAWATTLVRPRRDANGRAQLGVRWPGGTEHHARYDAMRESWERPEGWPLSSALVLYARIDGGVSVFDPVRSVAPGGQVFAFSGEATLRGLRAKDDTPRCKGMIEDLADWRYAQKERFELMRSVIKAMSPDDEPLDLGDPVRVSIHDAQDVPTLVLPYGAVPVTHVSAAVRRILSLAYLLVWSWHEHTEASRLVGREPASGVVLMIDEVEAHLHPAWQRRIVGALLRAIEMVSRDTSVQVFIVTHAPLVTASLETIFDPATDKLFHLPLRPDGVEFEELPLEKRGEVTNWLRSVFGLREARSLEAERAIEKALELQQRPEVDPDLLRTLDEELAKVLAPTDPFWIRWTHHKRQREVRA